MSSWSDPVLCDETFRQVQAQVAAETRDLKAEAKRVDRELATVRAELDQMTSVVARATRSAADALMAKLAETQERFTVLERRQREIAERQVALDGRDVDPEAVRKALAQFTALWDVLLTPERERVVRLLIDRVDYAGAGDGGQAVGGGGGVMTTGAAATVTLAFPQSSRPRQLHPVAGSREPRVARHLALAHEIERRVRAGELDDLAHAARAFGLTRARVTQIVSLTLLAPAIQAEILALPPVTVGRDPITERTLRPIVAEAVWERQIEMWRSLCRT